MGLYRADPWEASIFLSICYFSNVLSEDNWRKQAREIEREEKRERKSKRERTHARARANVCEGACTREGTWKSGELAAGS